MRTEYIYVLAGDNGKPFYCGHSVNPQERLQQHLDEARGGGKSFKCGHIRALLAEGQTVSTKVVDECPADHLADLEHWWIDQLEFAGSFLYNGNSGVKGSKIDEAVLREQIAASKSKARKPKSIGHVGPPPSDEELARWRVAYEAVMARLGRSPTKVEVIRELEAA